MTEYPRIERMESIVNEHGEVHAEFEEVAQPVEVRTGTATFDYETGEIRVTDGVDEFPFAMTGLITYEKPYNVYEGGHGE